MAAPTIDLCHSAMVLSVVLGIDAGGLRVYIDIRLQTLTRRHTSMVRVSNLRFRMTSAIDEGGTEGAARYLRILDWG